MGWELLAVEKPFVEQLVGLGWRHVEGDLDHPATTQYCSFTQKSRLTGLLATMAARRSAGQFV